MTDTRLDWPTSCDTLVVLGPHTRDGHTLFAKNTHRRAGAGDGPGIARASGCIVKVGRGW